MTGASSRVGVGSRFLYDGDICEVVELRATSAGNWVVLKNQRRQVLSVSLRELLLSDRAKVVPSQPGPASDDDKEIASVVFAEMTEPQRRKVSERAAHVREVLTGYRSGSDVTSEDDEPRAGFDPSSPLEERYAAKAAELSVSARTVKRWAAEYRSHGEAGLASTSARTGTRVDGRWLETALAVMTDHSDQSKPSKMMVITRANARTEALYGAEVQIPSRASAYRALEDLERRQPTFRLSTKRNRDIGGRPSSAYGKLRPTRPGEYQVLDTTPLDVFALDPVTLRWVQAELTVGMDWYSRCITGIRLTPVSTKAVDAASILYQSFRPQPAGENWPSNGVWPEHGLPSTVLVEQWSNEGTQDGPGGPAVAPETIVIDHGKVYVSEHLTSVCQRMGISIQPARLGTGRDKGPVERFFRTIREDLLQALPGYKGPDVHSRGANPEGEAFFFLDELEDIIREWVAVVYHHRPHDSLIDPAVPGLRMSPAEMFEHGVARAGFIEVPRDPDLGYEFLKTEWRSIQHYGVDIGNRRYNGQGLDPYRNQKSHHTGKAKGRWPLHADPDDITRVFFRDPETRRWHTLMWEHAPSMQMPMSEDALKFARKLAATRYNFPDDRLAAADLFQRWNLGLDQTSAERRIALRLSREQRTVDLPESPQDTLPSVKRVLDVHRDFLSDDHSTNGSGPDVEGDHTSEYLGDDDDQAADASSVDDDFYTDALEDV